MDLSQVTGIRRILNKTEYQLRYIDYKATGKPTVCWWKRPMTYPAMGFVVIYPKITSSGVKIRQYQTSWALIDRYGVACDWAMVNGNSPTQVKNSDGSYNLYQTATNLFVSTGRSAEEEYHTNDNFLQWPNPYGKVQLLAMVISSKTKLMDYPAVTAHTISPVAGLNWRFSDVTTKKIKLYARPKINSLEEVGEWAPNQKVLDSTHLDWSIRLKEHETDVVVDAGEPLVKITQTTDYLKPVWVGIKQDVTEMRTNLDDYKAKYDEATGGKFPKSQYPYLRATIAFGPDCGRLGIQTSFKVLHWDMMYLTFEVDR